MVVMHATGGTQTPIAALFLISVRSLFRYIFDFAQIAEENGVTRQAIHDLLKRVEQILERYEARLGLLARNDKDKENLGRAQELLTLYIAEGNTDRRLVKAQQIIIDLSNEGR